KASGVVPAIVLLLAFIPFVWGLGTVGAAAALTVRRGTVVTTYLITALTVGSSAYFPEASLPAWFRPLVSANPMTTALDGMRQALLGHLSGGALARDVGILAAASAVALAAGVVSFRLALARERRRGALGWERVDGVVGRASTLGDLRAHGLQLLAAARSRRLGQRPPAETAELENAAAMRVLAVEHLLRRIREVCDGQLVLMKGYEIALRYPDAVQRPFGDIDLLAPDPWRAYGQLRAAGFEPIGLGDAYYADRHHLQPLALP